MERLVTAYAISAVLIGLTLGCTTAQLAELQSAANKRDTICEFVRAWSDTTPALEKVHELCDQGASLKDIAAAYAGCYEVEVPE